MNMVDITIADGSRFRHSPFRKAYKYLFERPLRLHDLKEHLLIIHDTLHVYSFTLRGGVISYNQIRRRRAEPVTHSKSHLPVAEPKSHAAIDEGGGSYHGRSQCVLIGRVSQSQSFVAGESAVATLRFSMSHQNQKQPSSKQGS